MENVQDPIRTGNGLGFWPELLAFLLTVVAVWLAGWQARDLIWGLWISSLSVGYAFILTKCVRILFIKEGPFFLKLGGALFLLGFFTVHFGLFHFVHSIFLNLFFPLYPGIRDPFLPPGILLGLTLSAYWPVVLANFIAQRNDFQEKPGVVSDPLAFEKPYANVVRMHVLIFVFAGLSMARLDHMAIYPVLMFYFFPWRVVFRPRQGAASLARGD